MTLLKPELNNVITKGAGIGIPSKVTAVDRLKQSENKDKGQSIQK
jgi:hypothetical protein